MEKYYTITPAQAALIGKFNYSSFEAVDPFVGEQVDGDFLVSDSLQKLLKNLPEFKKFDWSSVPLVPKDQLDPKPYIKP